MTTVMLDKDTRNFTEIYSDYYSLVYSSVYTKVGNADDTSDICQDVFIRFYEKFNEVENPRKWLIGALRNVVLEHYRQKSGRDVNVDDVFDDISLTFVNGFRDTRLMIEEALEDMNNFEDEQEKVIFDLIAIHNFSFVEAGNQLGLTERQVRYRYGLIAKRLVAYFNKKGIKNLEDLL